MISVPPGVRVWLAARPVDMRKGFDGLAAVVQQHLHKDPFSGQLFVFRGKRGNRLTLCILPFTVPAASCCHLFDIQ